MFDKTGEKHGSTDGFRDSMTGGLMYTIVERQTDAQRRKIRQKLTRFKYTSNEESKRNSSEILHESSCSSRSGSESLKLSPVLNNKNKTEVVTISLNEEKRIMCGI